jgi:hypothetical protein
MPLAGTPQSDQGSIASALTTIYGHKKNAPTGDVVGARLTTKETMTVNRTYGPAFRSNAMGEG